MKSELNNDRPLFLQIREVIEDDILTGALRPDDQIPSNSQLVGFYGINPVTVHKGVSLLLDEGIIYKKRGLGMFVSADAPDRIRRKYQGSFKRYYVEPFVQRAALLGLSTGELRDMLGEER